MWIDRYANFDLLTGNNDGTSEENAWRTPSAVVNQVLPGNRVNIKQQVSPYIIGTGAGDSNNSNLNFITHGTPQNPIWYRGYKDIPGDSGRWISNYNANICVLNFAGNYIYVSNIEYRRGAFFNLNTFRVSGIGSYLFNSYIHTEGDCLVTNAENCTFLIGRNGFFTAAGTNSSHSFFKKCSFIRTISNNSIQSLFNYDIFDTHLAISNCYFFNNVSNACVGITRPANSRGLLIESCIFEGGNRGIGFSNEPSGQKRRFFINNNLFYKTGDAIFRNGSDEGTISAMNNYYYQISGSFQPGYTSNLLNNKEIFSDVLNDKKEIIYKSELWGMGIGIKDEEKIEKYSSIYIS